MMARKVLPGTVLAAGLGSMMIGFLLISRAQVGAPLTVPIIGLAVLCVGTGTVASTAADLVVGSVPTREGRVGGLSVRDRRRTRRSAGHRHARQHRHRHLPQPAQRALGRADSAGNSANESISRAAANAADLPRAAGTAMFDAAKPAFTTAFQSVTIIAAIITAGLAVLALVTLRQAPPTATAASSGGGEGPASADTATADQAPGQVAAALPISDVSDR
jgi:DHA2 family multidrug resistance protein-like MFS transporter